MSGHNEENIQPDDPAGGRPLHDGHRNRILDWLSTIIGFTALIWFLFRVIPKPSRATYPCQKAALPVAAGFVGWLAGILGSALFVKKAKRRLYQSKYAAALFCVLLAACAVWIPFTFNDHRPALADPSTPNAPIGDPKGIHPGRVAWVHDPLATDWNGPGDGHWFEDPHTEQTVVNNMLSQAILALAGQSDNTTSWDAIFRNFNLRHGRGDVGYQPEEKIAIKVNHTLCYNADSSTFEKNSTLLDNIDNSPQLTIALLSQLINVVGVVQSDISIGDPTRIMPNYWYDRVHAAFPDVVYTAHIGGLGRTQETLSNLPFYWSDPITSRTDGKTQDYIPTSFADAKYIINFSILKSHQRSGVTISGKNHYGSLFRNPNENGYYDMHQTLPESDGAAGNGNYRAMVDLMGHRKLGGKTLLYLVDGLFAGYGWDSVPVKWNMAPFNSDWPSSIFVSQDPVAIDSVGFDFLFAEWTDHPYLAGADDYLTEAALADNPPSGAFYDPEGDSIRMTSLGVHEHWNNSVDKQYSRNLGVDNGIELLYLSISQDTESPQPDPLTWQTFPFATDSTSITMTAITATDPSGVEYYFACTSGGGNDSGWQSSSTYNDSGLLPNTAYSYRVRARDKSTSQNVTAWSDSRVATTFKDPSYPMEKIYELIGDILVLEFRKKIEKSYLSTLKKSIRLIKRSKNNDAINQLLIFICKVQQDIANNNIDSTVGSNLIFETESIVLYLGGDHTGRVCG